MKVRRGAKAPTLDIEKEKDSGKNKKEEEEIVNLLTFFNHK